MEVAGLRDLVKPSSVRFLDDVRLDQPSEHVLGSRCGCYGHARPNRKGILAFGRAIQPRGCDSNRATPPIASGVRPWVQDHAGATLETPYPSRSPWTLRYLGAALPRTPSSCDPLTTDSDRNLCEGA